MLKSVKYLIFLLCSLLVLPLKAQESDASKMVTRMYDEQCRVIFEMKTERLGVRHLGYNESHRSSVNADLKVNGVSGDDYKASRNIVLNRFRHSKDAEEKKIAAFFDGKEISAAEEYPMFRDYVKAKYALISSATSAERIELEYGNLRSLLPQLPKKVKLTSNSAESVTGGNLWMFSNGIRVIYKMDKNARDLSYTFMFRGGYGSVTGLDYGQGAYVGDLLPLYKVRGMSGAAFRNVLAANGLDMNFRVSLQDIRVSGHAPRQGLELLLQAMLALSESRETDPDAFAYYRTIPRQSSKEAVMDSLFRPDFIYTPYRYDVQLPADLMKRADDEFYSEKFSNFDDGLIILVGSMSEYQVQSLLCKYLGAFRTGKQYSVYPQVQYHQRSTTSYYSKSGSPAITMGISLFLSLSSESYLVLRLAQIVLQNQIRKAFPDKEVTLDSEVEIFPYERYSLRICIDGTGAQDMIRLREVVSECPSVKLDKDDLKAYKAQLVGLITEETSSDEAKADLAISRYSGRKDLLSNYKDRIERVSAEQISDILEAFSGSGKVEYISR